MLICSKMQSFNVFWLHFFWMFLADIVFFAYLCNRSLQKSPRVYIMCSPIVIRF